jgi:hypothetical protein
MNKKICCIGFYLLLDFVLSMGVIVPLFYNMDNYFVPFVLLMVSKMLFFEIMLMERLPSALLKTKKGKIIFGCCALFLGIGIIRFYNLFALFLMIVFPMIYLIILVINILKRNYRTHSGILLFILFIMNMIGIGWIFFLAIILQISKYLDYIGD